LDVSVPDGVKGAHERVLLVQSAGRHWSLPLNRVIQVGPIGRMSRLPHAPDIFCGAASCLGRIVPVLDLARLQGTEDPDAAMMALVVVAGQTMGLRVAEVEGVRPAAQADAERLDLDAFDLPDAVSRTTSSDANGNRKSEASPLRKERGVAVTLCGQEFWLPATQIIELLDAADPVAVPWADPRAPAILLRGNDVLPVVRLDLLLGLTAPASGPVVVAQVGTNRVGFAVDAIKGITDRGTATVLPLGTLLASLPGNDAEMPRAAAEDARIQEDAWLAILLEHQLCLLPLNVVQSVALSSQRAALPAGAPRGVTGVRAIGGLILPVTDRRAALGLSANEPAAVDIVVALPGIPQFILSAQHIDGIVRVRRDMVRATGNSAMIGGVVRLGHRLAWLLTPSALAPAGNATQ
jgi:chemotaxis signal transduction protein